MIAESQVSPYDVSFRLLGFPVRVHPLFWLVAALLGSRLLADPQYGVIFLLCWIAMVFLSILVHELGHALAYRYYGGDARIWLYWFGGLAISDRLRARPVQQIVISLAGPAAGFLFLSLVSIADQVSGWSQFGVIPREIYRQLIWINLLWGLVNLLPIIPLDGGQVCREVCGLLRLRNGLETALKISLGTAGLMVVYSLWCMITPVSELIRILPHWMPLGDFYTLLLFGMLAYGNWQQLQWLQRSSGFWDYGDDDDRLPWQRR